MGNGVLDGRSLDMLYSCATVTDFSMPPSPNNIFHNKKKKPKRDQGALLPLFNGQDAFY